MKKYILAFILLLITYISNAQIWSELGGLNSMTSTYAIFNICSDPLGNIYAAGEFPNLSGSFYVPKWNGTTWSELGGLNSLAANGGIICVCSDASGNIYAGGNFNNSSGNKYVAKWNGTTWSELGGLNGLAANAIISSVCCDPSGNVYATGSFINSLAGMYVAKWNGTTWSELGGLNGLAANGHIYSICSDPSGNIYAAGGFTNSSLNFYVAKWNGTSWSELGGLNGLSANNEIFSICSDASGNIYAAGTFKNAGGLNAKCYVAKWDGTSWSELGGFNGLAPNYEIDCICSDGFGNIYAGGPFTNSSGKRFIAKWDGSNWNELGGLNGLSANGGIDAVCSDPIGNIYTCGLFTNLSNVKYIAVYGCPILNDTIYQTIPTGGSYVFNGNTLTATGTYHDTLTTSYGCDSILTLFLTVLPNTINESGTNNDITIFPNPTHSNSTISYNGNKATLIITDMTGKIVAKQTNFSTNQLIFDLSNQDQGIYFIELQVLGKIYRKKVVKE